MDEHITKRIHISGLTPAITQQDLSNRLSSFGTVKSIDGFGLLDGVGQPRKFAYATLETTKGKLARCMNLLSGVTWKGAKLRLGEAKLDFKERILNEHAELKRAAEASADEPPSKRRRLPKDVQGVHAYDMSLVTPENAATRGKWRVTPAGRLIRPMRMRPAHPLPPTLDAVKAAKGKEKGKVRKRVKEPLKRARRRTIDPTKWDAQYLKGIYLENAAAVSQPPRTRLGPTQDDAPAPVSASEESDEEVDGIDSAEDGAAVGGDNTDSEEDEEDEDDDDIPTPSPSKTLASSSMKSSALGPAPTSELDAEKSQSLGLLQSLFGDKEDWGGAESVGSDVDEEDLRAAVAAAPIAGVDSETAMDVDVPAPEKVPQDTHPAASSVVQRKKLKDLFAPREEEARFSLLGHLDLDLELDDDVPFDIPGSAPTSAPAPSTARPPMHAQPTSHTPQLSFFDATRPLFFPSEHANVGKRSTLDPTNWRAWFFRTDTPEVIKARWEETRGELTAGWKRRHREAVKSRRRRGGANGEVD